MVRRTRQRPDEFLLADVEARAVVVQQHQARRLAEAPRAVRHQQVGPHPLLRGDVVLHQLADITVALLALEHAHRGPYAPANLQRTRRQQDHHQDLQHNAKIHIFWRVAVGCFTHSNPETGTARKPAARGTEGHQCPRQPGNHAARGREGPQRPRQLLRCGRPQEWETMTRLWWSLLGPRVSLEANFGPWETRKLCWGLLRGAAVSHHDRAARRKGRQDKKGDQT